MVDPIVLAPSTDDEDALVNAIATATATGAELLLEPGEHLTRRGRNNRIEISGHGLTIRSQDRDSRATIKRPDGSIDLENPDDNHGLFFVPAGPSEDELAQIQWHQGVDAKGEEITFGVIIRGTIRIDGVDLNCNMGGQGLEPGAKLDHSCMLGFRGFAYEPPPGRVYVGFALVELTDIVTANHGYADDIWFSRGDFHPNIAEVRIDHLTSTSRVNRKRSTVDFSGLCRDISISNSDIFELGMEDTATSYRDLPRATEDFEPSRWRLDNIRMDRLDVAARGKTYILDGARLTVAESCHIDRAGGVISDSHLRVGPATNHLLDRENRLVFNRVTWTLDPDADGDLRGLRPRARGGESCEVAFFNNVFQVSETAISGQVIDSELTGISAGNQVQVIAIECQYPDHVGHNDSLVIARVKERGFWWFTPGSLGNRDIDVALPVRSGVEGIDLRVSWWPFVL
jgi:hypothetical protein